MQQSLTTKFTARTPHTARSYVPGCCPSCCATCLAAEMYWTQLHPCSYPSVSYPSLPGEPSTPHCHSKLVPHPQANETHHHFAAGLLTHTVPGDCLEHPGDCQVWWGCAKLLLIELQGRCPMTLDSPGLCPRWGLVQRWRAQGCLGQPQGPSSLCQLSHVGLGDL